MYVPGIKLLTLFLDDHADIERYLEAIVVPRDLHLRTRSFGKLDKRHFANVAEYHFYCQQR